MSGVKGGEGRFTVAGLRELHSQLVQCKSSVTESNSAAVVEALRVIAEMVVYGDNKSELLFDFFCEKNMMALFLEIMWVEGGCPARVHIQILQTLSILVNCVRNDTSLYYLLSNNYINEIIIFPHDFSADESLCDQYVSFMKSLSLRLDKQTIQFFFQEETGSFPLLNRAIELLDYPDPMVRIAAQSTILNIYSVNDKRAREYALQDEVMHKLFSQIISVTEARYNTTLSICSEHAKLVKAADLEHPGGAMRSSTTTTPEPGSGVRPSEDSSSNSSNSSSSSSSSSAGRSMRRLEAQLQSHLSATEDWLFYLQDIFGLRIMRLRRALVHHLMTEWIYPTLLNSLLKKHASSTLYGASAWGAKGGKGGLDAERDRSSSPRKTSPRWSPTLTPSPEEEEEDEDDAIINVVAALLFTTQLLSTVSDSMLHRAVVTALLHPLSRRGRKSALEFAWKSTHPGAGEPSYASAQDLLQQERNQYRTAFCRLLLGGNHRLSFLAAGLLSSVVLRDAEQEAEAGGEAEGAGVTRQCWISRALLLWPLSLAPEKEENPLPSPPPTAAESEEGDQLPTTTSSTTATDDGQAETGGEETSTPPPAPSEAASSRPRLRTESLERERAAAKGLLSRAAPEPDDLDLEADVDESAYIVEPDVMHLGKLGALARLFAPTASQPDGDDESSEAPLVVSLLAALERAADQPLITAQVMACTVFSLACQAAAASASSSTAGAVSAQVGMNANCQAELEAVLALVRRALQRSCDALNAHLRPSGPGGDNGSGNIGPGASQLPFVLQEELRRAQGRRWASVKQGVLSNALLYFPPTPETTAALGLDYDVPICHSEAVRRDVQSFLFLRALHDGVDALCRGSSPAQWEQRDLFSLLQLRSCSPAVLKDLAPFSEEGVWGAAANSDRLAGQPFDMKGKKFLDAKIVPTAVSAPAAEVEKSGGKTKRRSSGGMDMIHDVPDTGFSMTSYLFGSLRRSSPAPSSLANTRGDRKMRTGNVFFIQHDELLLLVGPTAERLSLSAGSLTTSLTDRISGSGSSISSGGSMASGGVAPLDEKFEVYVVAPLLRTEPLLDASNKSSLRLVVHSWDPVANLEAVGAEAADDDQLRGSMSSVSDAAAAAAAAAAASALSSGGVGDGRGTNAKYTLLQSRPGSTLWQLTLHFESETSCALAREHIDARGRALRQEQEAALRSVIRL